MLSFYLLEIKKRSPYLYLRPSHLIKTLTSVLLYMFVLCRVVLFNNLYILLINILCNNFPTL